MSFSPTSLRLLRQHIRSFELSTRRAFSNTIHTNVRPRNPHLKRSTYPTNTPCARRRFTTYTTPTEKFRAAILKACQQYPILLPILFLTSIGSLSVLGLLAYDQYTRVDPLFADWPAPVEQQLRVALHFTHVQPNPDRAAEHFAGALEAAEKCGMDPFSKEVMGIRIRLAEMLEEFGRVKASIQILKGIAEDCDERLNELSRGTVLEALKGENTSAQGQQNQDRHQTILRCIIEVKVKMAQLYDSDYIRDSKLARKTLSDAIGLLVQNTQDPQTKGFTEDNAAGLSVQEISAMLYDMGKFYAANKEHANAMQVYTLTLDALRRSCSGKPSCKEAQVLGSIAEVVSSASYDSDAIINGKPATPESRKAARKAAIILCDQSVATAEKVPIEEREDTDCEVTIIGSQITKATLLYEVGEMLQSQKLWLDLLQRLKAQNAMPDLIAIAEAGVQKAERSRTS